MACGVPCVVTDVGDAGVIVGDTGIVVPRRNSSALAEGCLKLLSLSDEQFSLLKSKCRQRIVENFTVEQMVERYEKVYNDLLGGRMRWK
jgi:glycosyltransferase involved in cell wall biosynthesis